MIPWDPFSQLASTAARIVTDAWTAAWLSVWNAGLWVLRLVLSRMDAWLTPDLSADGPGHELYQVTFWLAGVVVVIMAAVQLGVAAGRRDGRGVARTGVGLAQFVVITGGWVGYTVAVTTAVGGLTRAVMESLIGVSSWNSWQPWTLVDVEAVTDAGVATVLGLMGLVMWIAAIGHLLVILARDAALMVLVATGPIAAAGLANETTRVWFWKMFRWFHAAVFSPLLVVIVTGIGMGFASGVAAGKTGSVEASIGTALPAIVLICISVVSPVALFKLLAFVDPGTASGASMRAGLHAIGGVQGLLRGRPTTAAEREGTVGAEGGAAAEASADAATTTRIASAVQQGAAWFGPVGGAFASGIGVLSRVGTTGSSALTDLTNQEGVGHNTYQPDVAAGRGDGAARANREAHATPDPASSTPGPSNPDPVGGDDGFPGGDGFPPSGYPPAGAAPAGGSQQPGGAGAGGGGGGAGAAGADAAAAGGGGLSAAEVAVVAL